MGNTHLIVYLTPPRLYTSRAHSDFVTGYHVSCDRTGVQYHGCESLTRPRPPRRLSQLAPPSFRRNSILPQMHRAQTTHQRDRREQRYVTCEESEDRTCGAEDAD